MSNIEPNIIDPGAGTPPPPGPDVIVPEVDPEGDMVGSDEIREPDSDVPAVEPDPEERGGVVPGIRNA